MTRVERHLRAATPYELEEQGLGHCPVRLLVAAARVLLLLSASGW